eukprot:PhF_6_TR12568/c1_g1_i8/m.19718/K05681/ABCG2, CD338; ATP-binding cassette, subfamily G (WHITE), member 2
MTDIVDSNVPVEDDSNHIVTIGNRSFHEASVGRDTLIHNITEHQNRSFAYKQDLAEDKSPMPMSPRWVGGTTDIAPKLLADDNANISLVWKDLVVRAGNVNLIHCVKGQIDGGLIAIMGPSGSGKTTLLNCLAHRLDPNMSYSGELCINGEPYTASKLKKLLGYVMQDDLLSPHLTVRETLSFVAELRLVKKSPEYRKQIVEETLTQMSLMHCAESLIGSGHSGLSGGERKRVSVALELLTRPKLLFLDEPTSNLDSLDALQFAQSLRNLVHTVNCVIVCTIHQPQYKVFKQFDRLILLRSGHIVYDDSVSTVRDYCAALGRTCPEDVNPADHIMACITPNFKDSVNAEANKKDQLAILYGERQVDTKRGQERKVTYLRDVAPFNIQVKISMKKSRFVLRRRQKEWYTGVLINIINAVLIGTVYLQVGTGPTSNVKRLPALFFVVVNQASFGAITSISIFPSERLVILRDRATGNFNALPYYIGKVIVEAAWRLPMPILFCSITYFLIGLQTNAANFFSFLFVILLSFYAGMSLAIAVSTVSRVVEVSALILPLIMELCRLFAGYSPPLDEQVEGMQWINFLSHIFYGYLAVMHNEYDDLMLECLSYVNGTETVSPCPAMTTIDAHGVDKVSYGEGVAGLIVFILVMQTIGYLAFRFFKW